MSGNTRDRTVTPKSIYDYVQGLLKVEDTEDEQKILEDAVSICFNSFTQRKLQWDIYLEKLMELFLDLAFQTEKLSKIKQVLKSYRGITQNQHPDSLKTILQYYRDNKLQQLLNQQIPKQSLQSIKDMKSVQDDQASSSIIISSFNPDIKNKKQWIRANLKTVWDGYKTILDTVRLNHKMEGVYRETLRKIFQFVSIYNRKHQFKGICDNQRKYGLKNILSKRGDKSEQQKNYYIDIEKEEVNTNNIQIRFQQFDLATKLGLWHQAFQTLQDIKQIMRVRKGPVKNLLKCSYFQRLALIFKKSSYWHYHAYAFFNYYSIYITKSKLSQQQKTRVADKLVLSVLCIPPSTLQSSQSKESQQKIASMMISGNKIPEKKQLEQMMVSRGVIENSSSAVKQLWYFMFLDFDLTSLNKGIKLLESISNQGEYKQFMQLLEDILIYKQLISLAEVYQRMKYDSLISIIPFPKQKIQRVLLQCHHKKVIDFVLDQKQGIIIFEDQFQQTNPYQQFLSCFVDVAILHQQSRKHDKDFIIKKTIDYMTTAEDYYNNIRLYKIDEYKKKLKKPRQQLEERQREKQRKIQQQKRNQEIQKKIKEEEERKQNQEKLKIFINKKIRISQIISIKQKRRVKIGDKLIENLTDEEIKQMDYEVFEQGLKEISAKVASDKENRNKKRFLRIDYIERQRRCIIREQIEKNLPDEKKEKQETDKILELSRVQHSQKQKLKKQIEKVAPAVKVKIDQHYKLTKEKYEQNLKKFKQDLSDQFKKKVLAKARQLSQAADKAKKEEQQRKKSQIQSNSTQSSWTFGKKLGPSTTTSAATGDNWKRKDKTQTTQEDSSASKQTTATTNTKKQVKNDNWFRKGPTTGITESNVFSDMKVDEDDKKDNKKQKWTFNKNVQEKKEEKKQQKKEEKKEQGGSWFGKKKQNQIETQEIKKEKPAGKFVPPPAPQTDAKESWTRGKVENTGQKRDEQQLVFKSGPVKKDDKKQQKKTKGRGW